MCTTEFQVTGMTCSHCVTSVRSEVGQIPGVTDVQVSLETGALVVTAPSAVDDSAVLAAVVEAGYTAERVR